MPDPSSIIATLAAIKNSMDVVKAIKDADYDLDKAILKEKIAILVDSLLEAKIEASETLNLIQEKDNKILQLEEILKFKSKLILEKGKYFEINEDGERQGEPYCSKCWEVDRIAVHLRHIEERYYLCPQCKNNYGPEPNSWKPVTSSNVPTTW